LSETFYIGFQWCLWLGCGVNKDFGEITIYLPFVLLCFCPKGSFGFDVVNNFYTMNHKQQKVRLARKMRTPQER